MRFFLSQKDSSIDLEQWHNKFLNIQVLNLVPINYLTMKSIKSVAKIKNLSIFYAG